MLSAIVFSTLMVTLAPSPVKSLQISDFVPELLHTVSFTAKVQYGNQSELRKISEDFGKTYHYDYANIKMEAPFKVRVDSYVDGMSVQEIGDGSSVMYRVPRAGVHSKQNIADQPGRRLTMLDYGLLATGMGSFFESHYVRKDRATGDEVFDLTYANRKDTTRFRIWINGVRKMVDKKEWYGQQGQFRATFYYRDPKRFDGFWVPTQLEVRNAEDKLAGRLGFSDIKVNIKLPASDFHI